MIYVQSVGWDYSWGSAAHFYQDGTNLGLGKERIRTTSANIVGHLSCTHIEKKIDELIKPWN
uniref:Uncharacterized protein n=1 Tax=Arundo donax TaxID=35708 RepID=A0A0A8YFR1_ARUDO